MADYPDWTRAVRLLGIDADGNLVTVLVDADGQLTTLIKGWDGAAYQTVKVDAEGRLSAFVLDDESQWGDVIKVGNAEMAARLGSPVAYDWRGKVLWWTDFRHGIGGLYTSALGTGASVALDPTRFLSGGYSVKVTGGDNGGVDSHIGVSVDTPPTPRLGFYIRWCSDSTFDYLDLQMIIYDGAVYHETGVRFDKDGNGLYYLNSSRVWTLLTDQLFYEADYAWHGLKMVVDVDAGKYCRCLAGETEHDLSAKSTYSAASAVDQRLYCAAVVVSHAGNNDYAWIDSMVITVGEPA